MPLQSVEEINGKSCQPGRHHPTSLGGATLPLAQESGEPAYFGVSAAFLANLSSKVLVRSTFASFMLSSKRTSMS